MNQSEATAAGVDQTKRMAQAMYEIDNGGCSHRDAVAWLFVDHATANRYCTMAQAARRVAETDTAALLDRLLDGEGELRDDLASLKSLAGALLSAIVERMNANGDVGDRDAAMIRPYLRALARAVGYDHEGWFDDAND